MTPLTKLLTRLFPKTVARLRYDALLDAAYLANRMVVTDVNTGAIEVERAIRDMAQEGVK